MPENSKSSPSDNSGRNRAHKNDFKPEQSYVRTCLTMIHLSIRRYLFTRYMMVLLALALIPLALGIIYFLGYMIQHVGQPVEKVPYMKLNGMVQTMFRVMYIHFIIFFVANIFGFSLIRKEVDDRTLHLLFLQPVGKSTIIFTKFVGFLVVTWIFLSLSFFFTYTLFHIPYGIKSLLHDLFKNGRALTLVKELFVMLIALAMYGSFSMVMGSLFKTAWYGLIFYLWETGLPYLPSTMKFFTISHYLQAITPEKSAIPPKMFELYGEMPSTFRCSVTFLILLALFMGISFILIRKYECKYSEI